MPESFGYILRNRPFRENSRLLDVFTEESGRIPCIARPAKKRGKVMAGTLEPFRYLHLQWVGRGDVFTLTQADERGRHNLPNSELFTGLYLNELVYRLSQQHQATPELFQAYKQTLHRMIDPYTNPKALMRFELFLLETLGYGINLYEEDSNSDGIIPQQRYRYIPQHGIIKNDPEIQQADGFILSGNLLVALRDLNTMHVENWQELRTFLDKIILLLVGKPLNSRKFLKL
ncbi:MAG: DNA repair protein RecO [Aquificaceae bacterium]|nr:MAG: DNA repair protein RecO [Aquificaceae bacterium]